MCRFPPAFQRESVLPGCKQLLSPLSSWLTAPPSLDWFHHTGLSSVPLRSQTCLLRALWERPGDTWGCTVPAEHTAPAASCGWGGGADALSASCASAEGADGLHGSLRPRRCTQVRQRSLSLCPPLVSTKSSRKECVPRAGTVAAQAKLLPAVPASHMGTSTSPGCSTSTLLPTGSSPGCSPPTLLPANALGKQLRTAQVPAPHTHMGGLDWVQDSWPAQLLQTCGE